MAVDMFPHRFIQELVRANPTPRPHRHPDLSHPVWRLHLPAWKTVFTSLALTGHSSGYRLFGFDKFVTAYTDCFNEWVTAKAFKSGQESVHHTSTTFQDPAMQDRLWCWYEAGMAELWAYVWITRVLEDQDGASAAWVCMDARIDFKLKADFLIFHPPMCICVSAFTGDVSDRQRIETLRANIEAWAKHFTPHSTSTIHQLPIVTIAKSDTNYFDVQGIRLFSCTAISNFVQEVVTLLPLSPEQRDKALDCFYATVKTVPGFIDTFNP